MAHLLRVGDTVVNLDNVLRFDMVARNGDVRVTFVDADEVMVCKGLAAEGLRDWLVNFDNVEHCQWSGGSF